LTKNLEVNYSKRFVREFVEDIDYVARLDPAEKEWLEVFVDAVANMNMDAMAALAGTPERFKDFLAWACSQDNARRRDISWKFKLVDVRDSDSEQDTDTDTVIPTIEEVIIAKSEFFKQYRCTRCLTTAKDCTCPKQVYRTSYGPESYMPLAACEDDMLACLDVKKRIQAYDLLPYGNCTNDLLPGHTVQICMPHHLFKNAWGVVVERREMDGSYLVEIKSRKGLRDADGTLPKRVTMYAKPIELRRYQPTAVKG
jgi:hypothetical protein